jgi:hypothetical protein
MARAGGSGSAKVRLWPSPTESSARPHVGYQGLAGNGHLAVKTTLMTDAVEKGLEEPNEQ